MKSQGQYEDSLRTARNLILSETQLDSPLLLLLLLLIVKPFTLGN